MTILNICCSFLVGLISNMYSLITKGRKLLGKHRKRISAMVFLILEAASVAIDLFGKDEWVFLLAAFLLSVISIAMTMYVRIMERTTSSTKSQAERQLGILELVFSVVQLLVAVLHIIKFCFAINYKEFTAIVFPLLFSIIAVLFVFMNKNEDGSSGNTPRPFMIASPSGLPIATLPHTDVGQDTPSTDLVLVGSSSSMNHDNPTSHLHFTSSHRMQPEDEVDPDEDIKTNMPEEIVLDHANLRTSQLRLRSKSNHSSEAPPTDQVNKMDNAQSDAAQRSKRTLHGLQLAEAYSIFSDKTSYSELSEVAKLAKQSAEVARLREFHAVKEQVEPEPMVKQKRLRMVVPVPVVKRKPPTIAELAKQRAEVERQRELEELRTAVDDVLKIKGLDIDTIQQHYTT